VKHSFTIVKKIPASRSSVVANYLDLEHLPVHHTNEVAQAEMALGVHPWVNVWMHEDWILFEGGKMSKSLGHVRCLQDLVDEGLPPLAYRYFLLGAHYRKQQHYSADAMESARTGYLRMLQAAVAVGVPVSAIRASEQAEANFLTVCIVWSSGGALHYNNRCWQRMKLPFRANFCALCDI